MKAYDHTEIEKKWQNFWAQNKIYSTPDSVPGKDNFFLLVEFPYPSGNLHVGHWYAFAVPDILARAMRMQGKNVMYPIGFDAFGLPAENAAIKNGLNPRTWTEQNIEYMTKQIQSMGTSFDWSRKVSTIDPTYYEWTQWLFLQLYKKGLVYQKETAVNWCPNDKTVLANEQVVDGKCERCGHEVVQRQMLQWNIKITDYADRLIDDLEALDWPEQIKESQRNWIGRSAGAEIDFGLDLGKKYKYVLLHGFEGSPQYPRWKWYKKQLESLGHEVIVPALPNSNDPSEDEQVDCALNATTYDEDTVLFGHSLGAVIAMKVLEKINTPVARLVVAGGFVDPNFKDKKRNFVDRFKWSFDAEKIRSNAKSITILHDPLDYGVTDQQAAALSDVLKTPITLGVSNKPHFTDDKEPDVLMWLRPTIRVFTTRPDTLYGATYLVLAPEHPWVTLALQHKTVLKNNDEVQKYVDQANKKTELERQADSKEKTGVKLEGVEAVNPATGEKIPLFVADYVLGHYGTGAIMAVPAHDERDHAFAQKFNLPIKTVIIPRVVDTGNPPQEGKDLIFRHAVVGIVRNPQTGQYLTLKWKEHPWTTFITGGIDEGETPEQAAQREIAEETGYTDLKLVRVLGAPIQAEFFAAHKDVNRVARVTAVLFDLVSDSRKAVSPEEAGKYDIEWIDRKHITSEKMRYAELPIVMQRIESGSDIYTGDGILVDSGEFDGLDMELGKKAITEMYGRSKKSYRLRDWIVSRQRYWGVPIPIIHCAQCGMQPVPDAQLPVELPPVEDYLPEGSGKSPLAKVESFVNVACPKCGGAAQRETDTLDTFVDSSWYFLRYTDPQNPATFAGKDKQTSWMPVDLYSGGAEHTTMHLLYSRFWQKALYDCGLVNDAEPYTRRMNRSIILGPDGQKMSKSRGNVIDPDAVVQQFGADTVRLYLAFIGPYQEVANYPWNPDSVVGVRRFLERVWRLSDKVSDVSEKSLTALLHRTIKKLSDDIPKMKFNTAISAMMILLNEAEKQSISREDYAAFLRILAPFAPHITEELWQQLSHNSSIHTQPWPKYDEALLAQESITYAIQINGKTRGEVALPADADKDAVEAAAKDAVAERLLGQTIARVVVVPKRLVNFVLSR